MLYLPTRAASASPARFLPARHQLIHLFTIITIALFLAPGQRSSVRAEESKSGAKTSEDKGKEATDDESPFRQGPKVPQGVFEGGKGWLNTSGPITPRDLKGKIVIVDFWTYCCINCMHVLPELKAIEKKYPNQVVVIGVHSAKFENEKETDNIREAIQRYEIEHPVVNDADMAIWNAEPFQVNAWPTVAFIDPEGFFLGGIPGEVERGLLENIVDKLIAYHRKKGTLDESPVHFNLESEKLKPTPLRFPGKLLADEAGNRLFISDSNHNRIVVSSLDGELLDVIGNGAQGATNGKYEDATFNRPQGMDLVGDTLYIADTENHQIRAIDLKAKTVSTLAGTGKQARTRVPAGNRLKSDLSSPWALTHLDGVLYIAMAGPHQIWKHKLGSDEIEIHAGSGREDIIDGTLAKAAFAQPSDIVTDGKNLYVTDSEGSSIRELGTDEESKVKTVVGTADLPAARLFTFGDVDGVPPKVRFQHPIGMAFHDGALFVADSYNHKVRKVKLADKRGETTTVAGTGERGDGLTPPQLSEPEGLSVAKNKLYVADTNNHRIGVIDLDTNAFSVLEIRGLKPPAPQQMAAPRLKPESKAQVVPSQSIAPADLLSIAVTLVLPEGFKLNKLAPLTAHISANDGQSIIAADQLGKRINAKADEQTATVSIPLAAQSGDATVELSLTYGYCRDGVGGLCKIKTDHWRIPIELKSDGAKEIKLTSDATK